VGQSVKGPRRLCSCSIMGETKASSPSSCLNSPGVNELKARLWQEREPDPTRRLGGPDGGSSVSSLISPYIPISTSSTADAHSSQTLSCSPRHRDSQIDTRPHSPECVLSSSLSRSVANLLSPSCSVAWPLAAHASHTSPEQTRKPSPLPSSRSPHPSQPRTSTMQAAAIEVTYDIIGLPHGHGTDKHSGGEAYECDAGCQDLRGPTRPARHRRRHEGVSAGGGGQGGRVVLLCRM
jgi:hypothetical protein